MSDEKEDLYRRMGETYSRMSTLAIIRDYDELRKEKDEHEEKLKDLNARLEFMGRVLIPERFSDEGIKNLTVDGVGRVGLRADIFCSVKAGQKIEAYQWLNDIGSGDLIQDTVNSSTLKAFIKSRMKSGEDIPEEYFNITPYQQATITKS